MNSFQVFFAILGAVLYLVGFVPYVYHIFHGRVVPHAFSWTVWAIVGSINTYVMIESQGIDYSAISPLVRSSALILGSIIAWFMIHKVQISRMDIIAIILACACIVYATKYGASNTILFTILVDILVLIPTLKKIWIDPKSEDIFAWMLVVFSQAATLISLEHHTLQNSLFWLYIMCENMCVAIFIFRRRRMMDNWKYVFITFYKKVLLRR